MMKSVEILKSEEFEIGTFDKNGNPLKQFDFVVKEDDFEGISICCILYSGLTKEFVAINSSGWWVPFENLHVTEKLNDVIAKEFFGLEKTGEYWGENNTPFINMPVQYFNAINESALILEKLGRTHEIMTAKEGNYWYVTVDENIYSEERLGIAACLAAIHTVRKTS